MLERLSPRTRRFFVSSRLPNHRELHKQMFVKFGSIYVASMFMLVVVHTALNAALGFSYGDARYWAALALFAFNLALFHYALRFSVRNAAEFSLGTVIFAVGPVTPLAVFVPHIGGFLFVLAAVTGWRPFSEGPEPDGWRPLVEDIQKQAERAEHNRLKGRNE